MGVHSIQRSFVLSLERDFRGFAVQAKHKKYTGHYEVSTKDFPINFSSIFNWYERGLCSYCDSKKKKLKQKTIKQTVYKL